MYFSGILINFLIKFLEFFLLGILDFYALGVFLPYHIEKT